MAITLPEYFSQFNIYLLIGMTMIPLMAYALLPERHWIVWVLAMLSGYVVLFLFWSCFCKDLAMGPTGLGVACLAAFIVIKGFAATNSAAEAKIEQEDSTKSTTMAGESEQPK